MLLWWWNNSNVKNFLKSLGLRGTMKLYDALFRYFSKKFHHVSHKYTPTFTTNAQLIFPWHSHTLITHMSFFFASDKLNTNLRAFNIRFCNYRLQMSEAHHIFCECIKYIYSDERKSTEKKMRSMKKH